MPERAGALPLAALRQAVVEGIRHVASYSEVEFRALLYGRAQRIDGPGASRPACLRMAVAAAALGVFAIGGGLYASARLDTPSGPLIVVAALALFILTRIRLPKSGGGKR